MECRQSGLSDHQWCLQHNIRPGTFYTWISRLRQKGIQEIPNRASSVTALSPEIVKLELPQQTAEAAALEVATEPLPTSSTTPAIELIFSDCRLQIPNGADPVLLKELIRFLREASC